MATLPNIDFVLWNTVIVLLINGEPKQFVPFGDYNKQDVLEAISLESGIPKLELLRRLPAIWEKEIQ